MIYLCQFRDIFGESRTGIHSYRFFDIAVVDTLATLVLAYLLATYNSKWNTKNIFVFLIILSVFIHKIFCVETTLTNLVFR
jgi:ABC-type spermidine/putrescine transport system permease subunit I